MEKIHFKKTINAPKEKVWEVLWDDASYRQWTSAFGEGSYAEADGWKEGSEVKFLSTSGGGMLARVASNKPNEYMSFEHLGEIKQDGTQDLTSDKVQEWAGARENYTLTENDGTTELAIDMDMSEQYMDMFKQMWPKALDKVKELAEKK